MQQRVPFQWGKANFAWETNPFPNQSKNPFTWDDCALIIEVLEGLAGGKAPEDIWKDKEKKKICSIVYSMLKINMLFNRLHIPLYNILYHDSMLNNMLFIPRKRCLSKSMRKQRAFGLPL